MIGSQALICVLPSPGAGMDGNLVTSLMESDNLRPHRHQAECESSGPGPALRSFQGSTFIMPKTPSLADIVSELRTKDKLQIGALADFDSQPEGLSTGNLALDTLTGIGGFPKGRITELFGKPSSGKTTSALQAIARAQASGGIAVFLDYERTLDMAYCKNLGVDTDALIYVQPRSFEEGANAFRKMLVTGEVAICVTDSVATMVTENELNAETGAAKVADRAKMMHQYLRQIVGEVHRTGTCMIFLNHVMDLVDASPMGQKLAARGIKRQTTPGGTALPFYASLRIEFKQVGNDRTKEMNILTGQKEDVISQTKVQATVVKNKVGDPFGTAVLKVRYGKGFSQPYSVYKVLTDYAAIKVDGGGKHNFPPAIGYTELQKKAFPFPPPYRGDDWIKGEEQVVKALESTPAWFEKMEQLAMDLLAENGMEKVDPSKYDENGLEKEEGAVVLDFLDGATLNEETGELT